MKARYSETQKRGLDHEGMRLVGQARVMMMMMYLIKVIRLIYIFIFCVNYGHLSKQILFW
jgi:hypothetical protein